MNILDQFERKTIDVVGAPFNSAIAWCYGYFAITQTNEYWCQIHLPSGRPTGLFFKTVEDGAEACKELSSAKNSWEVISDAVDYRDIINNIRKIHNGVYGWELGFYPRYRQSSSIRNNQNGFGGEL